MAIHTCLPVFTSQICHNELSSSSRSAVIPFAGGQPTKRFNIAATYDGFALSWALDGRALLYIDDRLSNIWSQPIDGGSPVQLTALQGDHLFNFAYSPDGKWLAVARGRVINDVVQINDFR